MLPQKKNKQTILNAIKLLGINTAWVWFTLYFSSVVASQLLKTDSDEWVYLIAYGLIAILCAVVAFVKIPTWLIPLGGIYTAVLLCVITQFKLVPYDCLSRWWLLPNEDSLFQPSPLAAGILFCVHTVLIQLLIVALVRILEKRVFPVLINSSQTTAKGLNECIVTAGLRILAGQLLWCILPVIFFDSVKVYALFFTHHTQQTLKILLTLLVALLVFTFTLRTWVALLLSLPITVGVCLGIESVGALRNAVGLSKLWATVEVSQWQSTLLLCLTVLGLEVLGILQWKLIKRKFASRKQVNPTASPPPQ